MSKLTVDFEKVQRAVETLKSSPPTKDEVTRDPKTFLAKHGVEIDDAMNDMIKTRLKGQAGAQAAIVHIDAG